MDLNQIVNTVGIFLAGFFVKWYYDAFKRDKLRKKNKK